MVYTVAIKFTWADKIGWLMHSIPCITKEIHFFFFASRRPCCCTSNIFCACWGSIKPPHKMNYCQLGALLDQHHSPRNTQSLCATCSMSENKIKVFLADLRNMVKLKWKTVAMQNPMRWYMTEQCQACFSSCQGETSQWTGNGKCHQDRDHAHEDQ